MRLERRNENQFNSSRLIMTDFWNQLNQYTKSIGGETNSENLLSKILNHAEQERQTLEAQVIRYVR